MHGSRNCRNILCRQELHARQDYESIWYLKIPNNTH